MKLPEIDIIICGDWKQKLSEKATPPRLVLVYELEYHPTEWGYTMVNREKLPVPEDTVTFNKAGDIRSIITERDEVESEFLYFGISNEADEAGEILTRMLDRIPYVSLASEEFKQKWKLFRELYRKKAEAENEEKAEAEMKAVIVLMDILFRLAGDRLEETEKRSFSTVHQKALLQAICYMKKHLSRNCPIGEIAAQTGYSTTHFNYLFKKYTGRTPHEYYRALKLQEAKVQLLTTTRKIGDIAESLAFRSVSEFGTVFRADCGMSPRQFRKTGEY